jgi:VanZ family protein
VKILVLEYWTPLVVWLVTLFFLSTDSFSASETSSLVATILRFIFPGLPANEIAFWHGVIRKLAHIGGYFILAVFAYRCFKHDQSDLVAAKVRTAGFVLAAALLDEFHQSLTVSRGPSIVDVGYDCLGAVWALWIFTTYENRRLRSYSVL